jgi:hypothetical protein
LIWVPLQALHYITKLGVFLKVFLVVINKAEGEPFGGMLRKTDLKNLAGEYTWNPQPYHPPPSYLYRI